MPQPPAPQRKDVTIDCDDADIVGVPFKIPAAVIEQIATQITDVPDWLDFLKVAADWWAKKLSQAQDAKDAIRRVLAAVDVSENINIAVSGNCSNRDAITIDHLSFNLSGVVQNPFVTIDAQVDPGPAKTVACTVDGKPGRCRARLFTVSWYLKANLKGVVYSWLAQIDKITVKACCCSTPEDEWPPVNEFPGGKRGDRGEGKGGGAGSGKKKKR